jgi:hypothetical protein
MARTIAIAGVSLALASAPVDLDRQLVGTTGCNATEIEQLLASGPDRCAHALAPFLAEPIDTVDLANLIAVDPAAIGEIRALYAALPAPAVPDAHTPEAE